MPLLRLVSDAVKFTVNVGVNVIVPKYFNKYLCARSADWSHKISSCGRVSNLETNEEESPKHTKLDDGAIEQSGRVEHYTSLLLAAFLPEPADGVNHTRTTLF
jgi:hypothetical protein